MSRAEPAAIAALKDLLLQEREVIRKADFARIECITKRKQELIAELAGTPATELQDIRKEAARNQRLLEAALKGIGNARARLQQIRDGARGFTGYDRNGQARPISRGEGTMEIRA